MIGVIVGTHGDFGQALLTTLRMILGETEGVVAIDMQSQDSMESFQAKLEKALLAVDANGSGTLVLVDMLGGTPFNVALRLAQTHNIQIVTGVNLPMLIKAVSQRDEIEVVQLVTEIQKATRESIVTSLELFKK